MSTNSHKPMITFAQATAVVNEAVVKVRKTLADGFEKRADSAKARMRAKEQAILEAKACGDDALAAELMVGRNYAEFEASVWTVAWFDCLHYNA